MKDKFEWKIERRKIGDEYKEVLVCGHGVFGNLQQLNSFKKGYEKARKEALEDELDFLDEIEKFNMCNACDDVYKKLVQERINKIKEELKNE